MGTYRLLEEARSFFNTLSEEGQKKFRFLHVSTDEVYGTLSPTDPAFKEDQSSTNPIALTVHRRQPPIILVVHGITPMVYQC